MRYVGRFLLLACCMAWNLSAASAQTSTSSALTFESASVKPAAPDAPMEDLGFMIALGRAQTPHGLLTMTGPLPPFIMFAYGINDEVEARAMRARLDVRVDYALEKIQHTFCNARCILIAVGKF